MISSLQEDPTVIIAYNNDKLEANVDAKAWIKILRMIKNYNNDLLWIKMV